MSTEDDKAEKALKDLIMYGMLPPVPLYEKVVRVCFKKKIESILESDYNSASVYEISLGKLSKLQADQQLGFKYEEVKQRGTQRIDQIQERIKITNEMFDEKIEKLDKECKDKVYVTQGRQEKEVDEFEKKWNSPVYIAHFSKPSYNLLQLRFIERKQAIFKEYIDARKTKLQADKLQKYEEEMAHAQMENAMNREYDKLLRRQEDDLKKIVDFYDKLKKELKRQQAREIEILERTIQNIQKKDPKVINKKLHSLRPTLANTADAYTSFVESDDMAFLSPRTASKYAIFRDTEAFELNVKAPTSFRINEIVNDVVANFGKQSAQQQAQQRLPRSKTSMI